MKDSCRVAVNKDSVEGGYIRYDVEDLEPTGSPQILFLLDAGRDTSKGKPLCAKINMAMVINIA